jgi:hypothetical protein
MTATYEQIITEANRRAAEPGWGARPVEHLIIEVVREGWKPPEPVDPDVLAYREWMISQPCSPDYREAVLAGQWDLGVTATGFLAGARMAREQAQVVSDVLVEALEDYGNWDYWDKELRQIIDNYKAAQ